jgi:MFS family permease
MTAVQTLASIAYWMTYTWLPLFIYEKFRLSLTSAGFTATFYLQAASAAGIVVGGALADRWTRRSARGRILTQVMGLSAAAPALFLSGTAPGVAWLLPCLVVFGLGRGFFDCNVMPVLARIARPELRATGYGVFNFASCLAGGLMALAAGAVKDTLGLGFALQVSGFILAVAALLLLRLR